MCCGKKNKHITPSKGVPTTNSKKLHFLTRNFFGKVLFILLSFILMWGVPFMLAYFLFFKKEKSIINEI